MSMESEVAQYDKEIEMGAKAKTAYNLFIEGYITSKRLALFQNFTESGDSSPETLLHMKQMSVILNDMESEILNVIETGNLAALSVDQLKSKAEDMK